MKKELVAEIIQLEWDMFSAVSNQGGRASCQESPDTFAIMRRSRICAWPEDLLLSYRDDLLAAQKRGRNLMTEKYAWMMASTAPDEFARIAARLPAIDADIAGRIEDIVAVNVAWQMEFIKKYPKVGGRGRAIRTAEDSMDNTSMETYMRGELKTCSAKTIALLHDFTMRAKAEGINQAEREILEQVRSYGFADLEHAERNQ